MDSCQLESIVQRLNRVYELVEDDYDRILKDIQLHESSLMDRVETELDELSNKFDAAKRGLSLVNKLSPGMTKLKHTQRVMKNLSTIRSDILNLENKVKEMMGK
jgi:hypothetical protein